MQKTFFPANGPTQRPPVFFSLWGSETLRWVLTCRDHMP